MQKIELVGQFDFALYENEDAIRTLQAEREAVVALTAPTADCRTKFEAMQNETVTTPSKKRVAVYARISNENDRTRNSLAAQISHYHKIVSPDQEFVGVYADSGKTGTNSNRTEFHRLLADCEVGEIDIILTKSISRFARNTVILLQTIRKLKTINVEVYFERENINTATAAGELMISILASFAQEESRQVSENVKWSIRSGFKKGKPHHIAMYGYRCKNGECVVIPEEAEIVRRIYSEYLLGHSCADIAAKLNNEGIKNYRGLDFKRSNISKMLKHERYIGTLLLQKTYVNNHISKKTKTNKGELPMYLVENAHPAIIDKELFQQVQSERKRRKVRGTHVL